MIEVARRELERHRAAPRSAYRDGMIDFWEYIIKELSRAA